MNHAPNPLDILPLNSSIKQIMEQYPELKESLLKVKIAFDWLEGADLKLQQLSSKKSFFELAELAKRDDAGLDGDNPFEGEEPYLLLNQDICHGLGALGLRHLAKHIHTLTTRDVLLARAVPHQRLRQKTSRKAKEYGRKGGAKNSEKRQPLRDEIGRLARPLFIENPKLKIIECARLIEREVLEFIKKSPHEYKDIGSKNDPDEYFEFIKSYVSEHKRQCAKNKHSNMSYPPSCIS
ncbi:hypothetical protein V6S06_22465 [Aeromonas hydrophila]|uniref:hypothetical protein n=2 Tax=Aeromonas TaxID=642 RepID=UPI001D795169|nr:hypothetical protein [Aeromonas sp. Y289-2]MBE8763452.1 hypothetical protein [Aeromonas veronii]MDD9308024.1 hypothetical protein [Aeromonas hydrophila]